MPHDEQQTDRRLEQVILELLDGRAPGATMELVRQAAGRLVSAGEVEITQAGRTVEPAEARGPIRIRRRHRR
ncbi:DUF3253 domain-containing protein [Streptomyces sp. NPDC127574]|uniref:DUF3253 domain-containing protein n=1 Tax=Streptomyces sp. NPDC127574 TaxID=3345401 RepID=UPI00364130BA